MAETKVQSYKVEAVGELKEAFGESYDLIFTDYRGLTVEKITDIRNKLRELGADFKVIKNNFAKIALKELGRADVGESLIGPTAVAIAKSESGPVAKELVDFAKDTALEVKGGLLDGDAFDSAQVEAFSKLPTKNDLIAMLMSAMMGPVQNFVYAINGVPTKLVRTLQAVADKKGNE